jgi:uncharacterized membrane protein
MASANEEPRPPARRWTLGDMARGHPIRRPIHPMLVIFPIAFFAGALALDVTSRAGLPGGPLSATWAVTGGLIGAVFAILTGLAERAAMRPGSRIRAVATRHMWIQLTATAFFVVDLAVRWSGRHLVHAKPLWIVLDALGTITVIIGGDVGGQMVFQMGHRVGAHGEAASQP